MTAAAALRPTPVPTWTPIAGRLRQVNRNAVRVSRILCDERFQRWLSSVIDDDGLVVLVAKARPPMVLLEFEAGEGRVRLGIEEATLTPALRTALAVEDPDVACQVLTLLLDGVLQRMAPVFTGARVISFERSQRVQVGFVVCATGLRIALCGADPSITTHLASLLSHVDADLADWAGLRMHGRVRFMVRRWRADFVSSLAVGDVVLLGPAVYEQTLIIGLGRTIQVHTQMSTDTPTLHTADDPHMALDDIASPDAAGRGVEDLQLPVAFEVDTARVSLAELAAMRPGYIIELDTPLSEATIRLVCQGQTIGHGQLVAVGEQMGVRITHMGVAHGRPAER